MTPYASYLFCAVIETNHSSDEDSVAIQTNGLIICS